MTTEAMIADWLDAFAFLLLPFYLVSVGGMGGMGMGM